MVNCQLLMVNAQKAGSWEMEVGRRRKTGDANLIEN